MGFTALIISQVLIAFVEFIIDTHYTKKQIQITTWQQLKAVRAVLLTSALMAIIVLVTTYFFNNNLVKLFTGVIVGGVSYIGCLYVFNVSDLRKYFKDIYEKVKR